MKRAAFSPPQTLNSKWEFPKTKVTILGGLYNEDCSILGSISGSPNFLGNCQIDPKP